jgi:hypothetical protein
MTAKSKSLASLGAVLVVGIGALLLLFLADRFSVRDDNVAGVPVDTGAPGKVADAAIGTGGHGKVADIPIGTGGHGEIVDALIARNVAARGGAGAWRNVNALQLTGNMYLGQGLHVPYVLEQKRPGKGCLAFEFDNKTATQCVDGKTGWKLLPFMGRTTPKPMTEKELSEMAGAVGVDGLLFDSDKRGYKVELIGPEVVDGENTTELKVTLPGGAVRWVYLDEETGLEVKIEAMRVLHGQERLVETYYSNWQTVDGLLISRHQETRYEGDEESHFVNVERVRVNPPIEDARFAMPGTAAGDGEHEEGTSS